jgi:hypothetical protein
MNVNNELEGMWKETVVIYFKTLYQSACGTDEKWQKLSFKKFWIIYKQFCPKCNQAKISPIVSLKNAEKC